MNSMREELEKKLSEDFPVFFSGRSLPMTESLMCFGCECGDGWEPLIRKVAEAAEKWNKENFDNLVKAMQIKEKFGGLRAYTDFSVDPVEDVIRKAESKSFKTCEECGSKGKQRGGGWIYTRCDKCWDELQLRKKTEAVKYAKSNVDQAVEKLLSMVEYQGRADLASKFRNSTGDIVAFIEGFMQEMARENNTEVVEKIYDLLDDYSIAQDRLINNQKELNDHGKTKDQT